MPGSQPQPETLPNSTESPENGSENWRETSLRNQFNHLEKMEIAERMVGLDNLHTGLIMEGKLGRAWMQDNFKEIYGGDSKGAKLDLQSEEENEMGIQLGDNTTTHHHYPKKSSSNLMKAALVAAGVAVGGGLPFALPPIINYLKGDTVTEVIEGTSEGLRVLPPKIIESD